MFKRFRELQSSIPTPFLVIYRINNKIPYLLGCTCFAMIA